MKYEEEFYYYLHRYLFILYLGINPTTLMGANVACYLSAGIGEIESIKVFSSLIERMGLIGCSKAMLSNRVSFALNLTGA